MRNRCVEIHDSILAGISLLKEEAQLHFSPAYIHESDGVPGRDAGSGWVQQAILHVHNANIDGAFLEFPVHLTDGQTRVGDIILDNEIPVPLHHEGAFALRLQAMWQEAGAVTFTGNGAELELLGKAEYVEEFPGSIPR